MRYRYGDDCGRPALLCFSGKNEITGTENDGNAGQYVAEVWVCAHAYRTPAGLHGKMVSQNFA